MSNVEKMSNVETLRELTAEELNIVAGGKVLISRFAEAYQDFRQGHLFEGAVDILIEVHGGVDIPNSR